MSLVAFPQVLDMMGDKPDWVQNLGDAFLADPDSVMDTIQGLREKAKEEGNLETTKEQKVIVEEASSETIIVIQPTDPKVVYVPVYNPDRGYGTGGGPPTALLTISPGLQPCRWRNRLWHCRRRHQCTLGWLQLACDVDIMLAGTTTSM